ncbi:MAG: ATP-binding protein [Rhodothermales bacterium]
MITPSDLLIVPIFAGLTEADRQWLAEHMSERWLDVGEAPFESGAAAEFMFVILEGALQILTFQGGAWRVFDTFRAGRITGVLPYSRMTHFAGRANPIERTRVGQLPRSDFREMLYRIPDLGQHLIALMSDRVRSSSWNDQQQEKMLALGKLAAGLAHEINNPAAAVNRAAATLQERLQQLPPLVARLARHGLSESLIHAADGLRQRCTVEAAPPLSALDRGAREDAIADWLDDRRVPESWLLAATFVEAGIAPADLDAVTREVPDEAVPDLVLWLEGTVAADRLLDDIRQASRRVSEIVGSVKVYTHMDRAPEREPVDLRQGIESTLTMLGHELREKQIQVERDYDAGLGPVSAYAGELNQVWTNLIDNAIDAMAPGGTLRIVTRRQGPFAQVLVIDDGKGIPEELQSRIFEPFFTTKGVGEGTGLGLDIVHRIVTVQHDGAIRVESKPGRTAFVVELPLGAG